jgi:Xaa-Pro aminopeptidase
MSLERDAPREDKLRALVRQKELDAIVAMSPENFAYAADVHILTVNDLRPRMAFAVIPAAGEAEMIICSIEKSLAEAEAGIGRIHTYTEFVDDPIEVLVERLGRLGLDTGRIGIDLDYLPASAHAKLTKRLHNLQLVNTTEDIAAIRAIKTPAEIALLQRVTQSTHRAVLDGLAASKLGDTEQDMCFQIASRILRGGADGTAFLCFASGDRTPIAHAMATERVPQESEIIRLDLGGTYGSYSSDFARTYSSGNPTLLQRQTHAAMLAIQRGIIGGIAPGMLAEDIFFLARDEYGKAGLAFRMPHIGHSFGIELHESPMLRPGDKTPIAVGMALNIEPVVSDEAGNMYHTEDLIEVTPTGTRLLTLGMAPDEIPIIGQTVPVAA